jgi:hypothetical protein
MLDFLGNCIHLFPHHAQLFVVFDQYRIDGGEGREGAKLHIKIIWNRQNMRC